MRRSSRWRAAPQEIAERGGEPLLYPMDLGLKGHAAAVAAASRGLGRATAHALAAEGRSVALCGRDERAHARGGGGDRARPRARARWP